MYREELSETSDRQKWSQFFDLHSSYANDQVLSAIDELEEQIESMGINLEPGQAAITNVQIFDQAISFDKE